MTIRVLHVGSKPARVAADLRRRPDLAVESVDSASDAVAALSTDFDCVLLEDDLPGGSLSLLAAIRQSHPDLSVVLLVSDATGRYTVEPIGQGSGRTIHPDDEGSVATLASLIARSIGSGTQLVGSTDSSVPAQAVMDTVGDGVYTLDTRGRFTSINDTLVELTGYDREALLGEHCSTILSDRDIAASEREIRELLRGDDEMKGLDIAVCTADGEEIPCENRFSLLEVEGEFQGTVGVIRDITERKRMEAQLRESRDKIADLHEVATEMVRCDTEVEIYQLAVEAAESILAFDICGIDTVEGEYLVPRFTSSGMPGDGYDRMAVDEGIAGKTYQNGESYLVDDVQDYEDARPAQTEYRSVLSVPIGDVGVFQAGSREVGAFDETDAELAELLLSHVSEALARISSESALKESEAKYRTLVEQSRDAVFIYRDEQFVFVNERTCELTGYDRETLMSMSVLDLIHRDEREQVQEIVQRRRGGEEVPSYETKVVTRDGSVRHFEINGHGITYDGETAVLGSARDVTERKRRKQEIEHQNERLREFTSVVSHDLRNPLNVATGYLDLARETGDEEHFERVARSLDRMEQLIDDLLAQARHGQTVTDPQLLDLGTAAADAWENVETHEADLRIEGEFVTVEADENQLLTLLENLFRNAIEHVGPEVAVRVGPTAEGFFVADDGPGIPGAEREDIFERGYSDSEDGTGLGLSIVENIAEAHGWAVSLRDEPEGGACFEFDTG